MPTYDYKCELNGKIVEVQHRMSELISTWGELCERTGIEPGETPVDAKVTRLATGGNVLKSGLNQSLPPCQTGGGCSGGTCEFN